MDFRSFLDEQGVRYRWLHHPEAESAQRLAAVTHLPGRNVVKPVLVRADDEFVLCALPACYKVDLERLRCELGVEEVELASEEDLARFCGEECELGAEPPLGWIFGLPTLIDESLFDDAEVAFQAGSHCDTVAMRFIDYFHLAQPVVGHFGRQEGGASARDGMISSH